MESEKLWRKTILTFKSDKISISAEKSHFWLQHLSNSNIDKELTITYLLYFKVIYCQIYIFHFMIFKYLLICCWCRFVTNKNVKVTPFSSFLIFLDLMRFRVIRCISWYFLKFWIWISKIGFLSNDASLTISGRV